MPNNEQEIQQITEFIDSGLLQDIIDLAVDRYFAKLDERNKPKYEPGALYKVDEAGELQQAQMPAVLELLQNAEEGTILLKRDRGISICPMHTWGMEYILDDTTKYHFHTTLGCTSVEIGNMIYIYPDHKNAPPLIVADPRYYLLIPKSPTSNADAAYDKRLLEIAKSDWKSLGVASPLVSSVETK